MKYMTNEYQVSPFVLFWILDNLSRVTICLSSQERAGNRFTKFTGAPARAGKCGIKTSWHLHSHEVFPCGWALDDLTREKARKWGGKVKKSCRGMISIPNGTQGFSPLSSPSPGGSCSWRTQQVEGEIHEQHFSCSQGLIHVSANSHHCVFPGFFPHKWWNWVRQRKTMAGLKTPIEQITSFLI